MEESLEQSTANTVESYIEMVRNIGLPGIVEGRRTKADARSTELAEWNKISLLYAIATENEAREELMTKNRLLIATLKQVSSLFARSGIRYSIFKTLKPFPTTPSDVDVIIADADFQAAIELLTSSGYKVVTQDAYSATLSDKMIVDLQLQPSVSNLPYIPKQFLVQNTICRRIDGFDVCTLNTEAELIVIASHCIYKEQMFTLNDYYTITLLADQADIEQLVNLAERTKTSEPLRIAIGFCAQISEKAFDKNLKVSEIDRVLGSHRGFSPKTFPFKIPFGTVVRLMFSRISADKEMRSKLFPAIMRLLAPRQFFRLLSHFLVRKTY